MNNAKTQPMDDDVIEFSKAVIQHESSGNFKARGKSNEYGAAQWVEPTWNAEAKKYLGHVPKWGTDEMTPELQKAVLYSKFYEGKKNGKNLADLAAEHNSGTSEGWQNKSGVNKHGVRYDVPAYVKAVTDIYHKNKQERLASANAPQAAIQGDMKTEGEPTFKSSVDDSGLTAGLKALGNTPKSAFNFAKGALNSFNPLNVLGTLGDVGSEAKNLVKEQGIGKSLLETIKALPKATYETLVPQGVRSLVSGDLEGATKSFTEDPFGQAAPIVLSALGGARLADKKLGTNISSAVDTAISKTGQAVTNPAASMVSAPANVASRMSRSVASQLTGLDPESITKIVSNPEAYSKMAKEQASRGNIASEFGRAVEKVDESLKETGERYNPIRESKATIEVPEGFIDSALSDFGLKTNKGRVISDTNSSTRNLSDVKAVQKFVQDWGSKRSITPNEFLNMRSDLADLANYDKLTGIGKTKQSQIIADKIRQKANEIIRPKIPGLEKLDSEFAPIRGQFDQIRKDFLQRDQNGEYVFKDGAVSKIANAANKGKDALLARMEEVMPGVTKQIEILKTVEDIEKAYGNKIGTYTRGAISGGSIITGNVAGIIAAIMTNPSVAVPLLRGLGYTTKTVAPVINALKTIAGDINNLKSPFKSKERGSSEDGKVGEIGIDMASRRDLLMEIQRMRR